MSNNPHYGVNQVLEDEADRIIFGHLHKIVRHADKSDVLTPWKEKDRRSREVLHEAPDGALIRGNIHREYNWQHRHLNHEHGMARSTSGKSARPDSEFDDE